MSYEELILAHDLGTAGNRAGLVTPNGEVINTSDQEYKVNHPNPGWAEQDPSTWWDAVVNTTRDVLEKSKADPENVIGISFDAMLLSAIPLNKEGDPLRPAIIWLDTRAEDETEEFQELYDIENMLEKKIVPPLSPKDPIPKIMWIKNQEPQIFENTHKFVEAKGFLIHKCTGNFVTDPSEASLTGMYSLSSREREPEIPEVVGIEPDQLPEIKRATDIVGTLTSEASEELGLPENTPVVCGSGDPTAAAIGSGAISDEEPHLYIGSSGWIALHTEEAEFSLSGVGTICSADPDKYLLIGQNENSASCYEWFKNNLGQIEKKEAGGERDVFGIMDEKAENAPAGSRNLLFAPWMGGERCPFIDPQVRGGFINLSFDNDKGDMIRAVLEGVAYNLRWVMDEIIDMGHDIDEVKAVGGGAKSDVWLQIMSDVLNRKVGKMSNPAYAGCKGTALTAAVGLEMHSRFDELENMLEPVKTFSPNSENVETYDKLYGHFRQVRENLSPVFSELNKG